MVTYREANEEDYVKINDFHNRIYSSKRTIEQFYWEFHNGPFGKSVYIVAEDGDKVVGTNCVIPINLIDSNKQIIRTGKSEDTLVDPQYRGQNIFYKLYQLLFEKCIENDIKVIWGFTSAFKPFKKLGFEIPYEHIQSLAVNKVFPAYKYLSGLNKKNKPIDQIKIFGLCLFSKSNFIASSKKSILKRFRIDRSDIVDQVTDIIQTNMGKSDGSFAIHQTVEFQNWRIYQNPNFYKTHTFGFYDNRNLLQGLIVFNSHPDGVAYVNQSTFRGGLKHEELIAMITHATMELFNEGISLVRNWHFYNNPYTIAETEFFKKAKYKVLNRGIGFVWKDMKDTKLNPMGFHLSRIATQGVT